MKCRREVPHKPTHNSSVYLTRYLRAAHRPFPDNVVVTSIYPNVRLITSFTDCFSVPGNSFTRHINSIPGSSWKRLEQGLSTCWNSAVWRRHVERQKTGEEVFVQAFKRMGRARISSWFTIRRCSRLWNISQGRHILDINPGRLSIRIEPDSQ